MVRKIKGLKTLGIGVLLIMLVLSGCTTQQGDITDDIKTNFLQAIEDVTCYKFSTDMTITMSITNESGTTTTTTDSIQNGIVDILNTNLVVEGTSTNAETYEIQNTIYYIVDGIIYSGTEDAEGNITWTSNDPSLMGEDTALYTWYSQSQLEGQAHQILEIADVEQLNDETIDGVECYVIKVTPNFEETESDDNPYGLPAPESGLADMFQDMDIRYWISKEDNLLIKAYTKISFDMSWMYAYIGGFDSVLMVQEMEQSFYDYNIPVSIELPPEATEGA